MYFIDQRIERICMQLQNFRILEKENLPDWEYKHGLFFQPEEAENSTIPWEKFDVHTMRWYAYPDGSADHKFRGQKTDYLGIPGEHYWFRCRHFHGWTRTASAAYASGDSQAS